MKLINSNYEIIEPVDYSLENLYKFVELCGRVCYKSEDKITSDSATKFVDRLIKSGHGAMLEHGTVYLRVEDSGLLNSIENISGKYKANKYSKVNTFITKKSIVMCTTESFITTNLRVLVENNWMDDLKYICEPTEYHEKRITVRFVCDRGVSHEFVRHRVFSFAQESTRYCNYSKDKFGNEITFIKPCFLDDSKLTLYGPYHAVTRDKSLESVFIASLNNAEKDYIDLIESGWKPQEARAVLPNALKTELIMTGFTHQWEEFFKLRDDKKAHPDAYKLAHDLHNEFKRRNYVHNDLLEL